jgi:hypothetical protein
MKLREKFMTVCSGCDGTREYEEPIGGFENSITYKTTQCDCENGKELDWRKVDSEIKRTKEKIEELQNKNESLERLCFEAYSIGDKDLLFSRYEKSINVIKEYLELETYLEELEVIE